MTGREPRAIDCRQAAFADPFLGQSEECTRRVGEAILLHDRRSRGLQLAQEILKIVAQRRFRKGVGVVTDDSR